MLRPLAPQQDLNLSLGLALSLGLHVLGVLLSFLLGLKFVTHIPPPETYSVSIVGGKVLGSIAQAPKKADAKIATPKKVSEPPPRVVPKAEPKKEVKKDDSKVKPELSLAKKDDKKAKDDKKKPEEKKDSLADINKQLQKGLQRYLGASSQGGGQGFGAAKLGGQDMGGGVVRPPEFFEYKTLLESHLKAGWRWFDTAAALIARVQFDMGSDGALTNIIILTGSGNTEFDDSVLRAVNKANPAPRPPESVYEKFFKRVTITFDPRE